MKLIFVTMISVLLSSSFASAARICWCVATDQKGVTYSAYSGSSAYNAMQVALIECKYKSTVPETCSVDHKHRCGCTEAP